MNILDLMPICYMSPYIAGLSSSLFEIDFMEYATDGAARSAWDTSSTTPADKNGTHTITANGNAAYSTAQKSSYNSSTKSVAFDGTGDYLSIPDSDNWNFGTGDFTIDFFVRFNAVTSTRTFFCQRDPGGGVTTLNFEYLGTTKILQITVFVTGSYLLTFTAPFDPATDTWYHIAWVREDSADAAGSWGIYINGTRQTLTKTSGNWNATLPNIGSTILLYIGQFSLGTNLLNGYLDNYRVTKGTALWTANFTISDAGLLYAGSPNFGNLFIGENTSLDSLSESTIKTEGSYALKLVATTGALNQTVTKTLTGGDILDLTGKNTIKFDARSTATGGNLELNIHDSGGTTSTHTITIASADTYQAEVWDISGVADADKDAIDQLQMKVLNAGSARDFYVDNVRGSTDLFAYMTATGGTITTDGDYKVHTFLLADTGTNFTVTNLGDIGTVEYLVVGGGGGGSYCGGGAGGFRTASGFAVAAQAYEITVGDGGAQSGTPGTIQGSSGESSVFSTISSAGGGGGGAAITNPAGLDGGSGGGAGDNVASPGSGNTPSTTPSQGSNGGHGVVDLTGFGGGGGASAVGGDGIGGVTDKGGNGGNGTASSITGSAVTYAGGGGGLGDVTGGTGGTGGGGNGGGLGGAGTVGTDNLGGGGGGGNSSDNAKVGGSGIVIIRYQFQ